MFVSFGQSSGPIPPFNMALLSQKGSLFATRPTLFAYIAKREDLEASAAALFDVVFKGVVKIKINQRYALKDAAQGACRSRRPQDHRAQPSLSPVRLAIP